MRFIVLVIVVIIGAMGVHGYLHDPAASAKLIKDLKDLAEPAPSASASWIPPAMLPAQPNWTWKTSDGHVYHNVKIIRIDAACVTIVHSEGGGRVPISTLSPDMQKYFNYDPAAAADADRQFEEGVEAAKDSSAKIAQETADAAPDPASTEPPPDLYRVTDNYTAAVSEAKADKKMLLLHFTGSDWCPGCKMMDEEVLSTSTFKNYSAANFVVVTLDFPRGFELSTDMEAQNNSLQERYRVTGYPTLLITDTDGTELARTVGVPVNGPDELIEDFKRQIADKQ